MQITYRLAQSGSNPHLATTSLPVSYGSLTMGQEPDLHVLPHYVSHEHFFQFNLGAAQQPLWLNMQAFSILCVTQLLLFAHLQLMNASPVKTMTSSYSVQKRSVSE